MFETRYGWSPERAASSACVRSSPRSISPCHSRARARSRTISGSSGGFGGFGGARSGFFAGFETTSLRFLLPSPLGRHRQDREEQRKHRPFPSLCLVRHSGWRPLVSDGLRRNGTARDAGRGNSVETGGAPSGRRSRRAFVSHRGRSEPATSAQAPEALQFSVVHAL